MSKSSLKQTSAAALLAALSALPFAALAGPADAALRVDHVGYDVASDLFMIVGEHFLGADPAAAPTVEIDGRVAPVLSYSDHAITAASPAGLPAGRYAVRVKRAPPVSTAASSEPARLPAAPLAAPGIVKVSRAR